MCNSDASIVTYLRDDTFFLSCLPILPFTGEDQSVGQYSSSSREKKKKADDVLWGEKVNSDNLTRLPKD